MKNSFVRPALTVAALLVSASLALAVDATKTPDVKGAAKATADSAKTGAKATADTAKGSVKGAAADAKATATDAKDKAKGSAANAKAAAATKTVDINTATEAELKTVPGIGDTYASKIIAGRPYANKAQLKSRNILPAPVYEKVKDLIVAKKK